MTTTTTTDLMALGYNAGWRAALVFVQGTKARRREIRRRIEALRDSGSRFADGWYRGFTHRIEQRVEAIEARFGRSTSQTRKLRYLVAYGLN